MSESRTYTILGVIGTGGFGKVYRARLQSSGGFSKDVAVKVLHDRDPDPDLLSRFRDEARILGLLRDRAIVSVDPPTRLSGRWAVVMDFVDGESAAALLKRMGPFPPGVACEIVGELARALDKAFRFRGPDGEPLELLHRDIKPANIQITPTGEVRLLDFGVARASFAGREAITTRSIAGTPGYIAPERLSGVEGPQGDVYSLGVVLWVLLTGERPADSRGSNLDARARELTEDDPERREALLLASRMRRGEDDERPSTREVERECRRIRQRVTGPWLRDWAEKVPERELKRDELAGQALSETLFDTRTDGPLTQNTTDTAGISTSVLLGTGVGVLGLGVASIVLGVVAALLVWGLSEPSDSREVAPAEPLPPIVVDAAPDPIPAPAPANDIDVGAEVDADGGTEPLDDVEPAPAPESESEPAPAAPVSAPAPRPDPAPASEPVAAAPEPAPAPVAASPEPARPVAQPEPEPVETVGITFNSTPWGAAIHIDGSFVANAPLVDHPLPVGRHTVRLSLGERTVEKTIRVGTSSRYPNRYDWVAEAGEDGWRPRYP
jgi:serine/threonine-protein kinase